jgi:citrate synthase
MRMEQLTAAQAAARLGVKVETVYAYVSRGALTSRRVEGARTSVFDADEVEALARRGRPRRSTRPPSLDLVIESRLTAIAGHRLLFRGHDALELARAVTFEQVAELLWTGELPARPPVWEPADRPPLAGVDGVERFGLDDRLHLAVVLAGAADPLRADLHPAAVAAAGRSLLVTMVASLPLLGEDRVRRLTLPAGGPPIRGTLAGGLWPRLTAKRSASGLLAVLNAMLVLLADHELAASTLAARVAASTRADPYAVVGAGLGPLAGPLHGGASQSARRVFDVAADGAGAGPALAQALELYGRYPAFGHPLYPDGDPRTRALMQLLRTAAAAHRPTAKRMDVVDAVLAAVQRRVPVQPNVDFAVAALGFVALMPEASGTVIFTIARTAGWLAHAIEEYEEAPVRFRPRAVYRP